MKQRQNFCIFCGGPNLSMEHLFADWMRDLLPNYDGTTHAIALYHGAIPALRSKTTTQGKLERPGNPRSKKLRVACIPCNTRWMSRLQNATKPILTPFAEGKWKKLNARQQATIAAWATMTMMVYQYSDEANVCATQSQRDFLRVNRYPPRGWHVWIGHFEHPESLFSHWSFIEKTPQIPVDHRGDLVLANSLMVAGQAVIQTLSYPAPPSPADKLLHGIDAHARSFGLQRIWPIKPLFRGSLPEPFTGASLTPYLEKAARILGSE